MNMRLLLIIVLVLAIGGLSFLNWETVISPMPVSFGFGEPVQAPLILILLSLTTLVGVLFLAYVLWLQGTVILDHHRLTKEIKQHRELADKAEASRFTELREFLIQQHKEGQETVLQQLDVLEEHLYSRVDDSDNSTAAYLGQLEDQLRRPQPQQLEMSNKPIDA